MYVIKLNRQKITAKFIEIDSVYENCLHKSFKQVLTKMLCLKFYSLIFNGCFDWTISNCAHFLQYKNGQHCTNCIAKLLRIEIPLGQSIMFLAKIPTKYNTIFYLNYYYTIWALAPNFHVVYHYLLLEINGLPSSTFSL